MSNNNYKNNHHPLGVPKNLVDLLEASLRQGMVRTRATTGPNLRWTKKSIRGGFLHMIQIDKYGSTVVL